MVGLAEAQRDRTKYSHIKKVKKKKQPDLIEQVL